MYASTLNVGHSAPATSYLLKGLKVNFTGSPYELVTPTGAGIYKTLVRGVTPPGTVTVSDTGFGAGSNDIKESPNLLKVVLAESKALSYGQDRITVIQTNIDDMKPSSYDYVMQRLFDAGALDVFLTHTYSKKSRMGALLTVLAPDIIKSKMARIIFKETTTIGLRFFEMDRFVLKRKNMKVQTKYGAINFKMSRIDDCACKVSPEYEDCKRIATKVGVPLRKVYREAEEKAVKI